MTTGAEAVPWPAPASVARLNWSRDHLVYLRVDHIEEDLLIGRASLRATLPAADTGAELEWGDHHGLFIRRVTVVVAHKGRLELAPSGPSEHIQRRRFFRADTALGVTLAHGGTQTKATVVDLSEGGARLRLDDPTPVTSPTVTAHLMVDGFPIAVPGRVVRDKSDEGDLGVAFDELAAGPAAVIRKQVFSAQLEARRKGAMP